MSARSRSARRGNVPGRTCGRVGCVSPGSLRGRIVGRPPVLRPARRDTGIFRDEDGFSTLGMVVALLVTLALVFSAARVYRVSSAAADVQNVADAAVLAAQNEVAEFMVVVRVCDAVVLSLSLAGIAATGLGVAALCTPVTAGASKALLSAGKKLFDARDTFAEKASAGLNRLQRGLPFLAAANAASVAAANNGGPSNARYIALAVLVPEEGREISVGALPEAGELADAVDGQAEDIRQAADEAERAAAEANEAKDRAFARDCGDAPSYCMYERAAALSGLSGSENPRYRSVDAWSFSVALARAQAYYPVRLAQERPQGTSVEERARSALRERFYRYAVDQVRQGYVHDDGESFDAYFPHLPKNTGEMRGTGLYTEAVYPITDQGGPVMHAWAGCPAASGTCALGSIAQMEQGGYAVCPECGFTAASMGKVAAASTSIENGFEYHYEAVAREAELYEQARDRLAPLADAVKEQAGGLIEQCRQAASKAASQRIDAQPPGYLGTIALVANVQAMPASTGFESSFVQEGGVLGVRAAVSGATLLADPSGEGRSVISSLLDGVADRGGAATGMLGTVLDCWSGLLQAYLDGQAGIDGAIAQAIDAIPFASESGLGTWAAGVFGKAMGAVGLEPANLDALRPVLVGTGHVAAADDGAFSVRFLTVRERAQALPGSTSDVFSSLVTDIEQEALGDLAAADGPIELATIKPLGDAGPSIPITVTLPPAAKELAGGAIEGIADALRGVYAQVTGVRVWE